MNTEVGGGTLSELYSSSKRLLLRTRDALERLERLEYSSSSSNAVISGASDDQSTSVRRDINQIQYFCSDMDRHWRSIAAKSQRDLWKRKVEQVSEETESLRASLDKYLSRNQKRIQEAQERAELFGRANADSHILRIFDEEAQTSESVHRSSQVLEDTFATGVAILSKYSEQRQHLKMKVVGYESCGGPHVLQLKEAPKPTVGDYEVMIKVAATGLNIYDALCRRGSILPLLASNSYLGFKCSGVINAVGSKVFNFKKGDEVCAILRNGGGYAEFVSVSMDFVVPIPSGVSIVEAAALPLASCFSLYALSILSEATPGKRILIHEAACGFDIFALQYAKYAGCEVFTVAGMEEKLLLCKMLGADVCINYKKQDFRERVDAETGGKGVDIIVDVNGSDNFQRNVDCLAIDGSLVNLGAKGGHCADIEISVLGAKNIRVVGGGWELLHLTSDRLCGLLSNVALSLWPLIEAGCVRPIIGDIFRFSQVAEAHRALEEYRFPGKLLLVP